MPPERQVEVPISPPHRPFADGLEEYPYEDTPFWDEDDSEEYDENEVNGC